MRANLADHKSRPPESFRTGVARLLVRGAQAQARKLTCLK
jgi:hypothetical protein